MPSIIQDNTECLRQGIELLGQLDDDAYSESHELCHGSSIGGHLRHNVDHYYSFLRGLATGTVDYDARARNPEIETSIAAAREALEDIVSELEAMDDDALDRPLSVVMDSGAAFPDPAQSTVRRELQFLLSHTVHHYALISTIRRIQRAPQPALFGVAPSTIKHQLAD